MGFWALKNVLHIFIPFRHIKLKGVVLLLTYFVDRFFVFPILAFLLLTLASLSHCEGDKGSQCPLLLDLWLFSFIFNVKGWSFQKWEGKKNTLLLTFSCSKWKEIYCRRSSFYAKCSCIFQAGNWRESLRGGKLWSLVLWRPLMLWGQEGCRNLSSILSF